jgi:MHS family shikimate/dehydroshikimate transporter-like MFS transporter
MTVGNSGASASAGRTSLARVAFASAVGSALEWYDFFIYGTAAALVFNEAFFPKFDPAVGTLAAFATFGVGFVARPFGGLFFGHFGDRLGRKPMLVATLLLVGIGTFLIGLLPTYARAGVWAPAALVVLRLVQGFGAGAEYGGAVIFAVEHAPPGRRGVYGSWAPIGVVVGNLLAVGVFALVSLLPHAKFIAWGWRLPFLISIVLIAVGLYVRARVEETPIFTEAAGGREPIRLPVVEAIRRHPRSFVVVIGARLAENGLGYLFPVFGLSYVAGTLHLPREVGLLGVLLGNAFAIAGVAYFSWLSDRVGRRPVYLGGALFSAAFAFPFFWLVNTRSPGLIVLAFVGAMAIGGAAMFGPQAAYFSELFGPRLRYSGFAFARELGSILAGGPAPFLSGLLVLRMGGKPWGVALYIIALSLITAASIWIGPETFTADPHAEHGEAAAPAS